jgi:hypothetical protein
MGDKSRLRSDVRSWAAGACEVSLMLAMPAHIYEVRRRRDKRGVDLISDALPFGRLWYGEPNAINNAIGYAKFRSRSHDVVIRVYDEAGNVNDPHEQVGEFREP